MARKLPPKDVVIIGLGWTGSILGYELAKAGLDVVAIERGPWRDTATDFPPAYTQDELRYAVRLDLFLRPDQETLTFRNNASQSALPIRNWASFLPGNGVGGAGVHWNGQTWRFLPTDFRLRSHLEERYGRDFLPNDMTIQDWPVSYDELEPYYDRFEKLCGTSGKAGNIRGEKLAGGNPFEGWRSSEYPTPPLKQGLGATLFAEAARKTGHMPFPQPASNLSEAYTNPLGMKLGQCTYCGFCERFGCGYYAYQTTSSVNLILKDKILNPFIATGAHGMIIDDYNGDNFDHSGRGFFGGGYMGAGQTGARPIQTRPVPKGTPKWGAAWKKATAETYQRAFSLSTHGSSYSYKDCYLDLDPTYKDRLGRPLLRMTFDFHDNELKMSAFLTERLAEIAKAMDPAEMTASPRKGPYDSTIYQTTHNTGGTVMGADPATSVVNRFCQSWDVHNLFVPGGAGARHPELRPRRTRALSRYSRRLRGVSQQARRTAVRRRAGAANPVRYLG